MGLLGWLSGVLAKPLTEAVVCDWGGPTSAAADCRTVLGGIPQGVLRLTEGSGGLARGRIRDMRGRVLIVDDNPGFRRLAASLLEEHGYEVVGAVENADGAASAVERLAPEVVLLDVNLPDGSGFDVAARLVREWPRVVVLLTSTRGGDEFEQLALASGAAGFVPKDDLSATALDRLVR